MLCQRLRRKTRLFHVAENSRQLLRKPHRVRRRLVILQLLPVRHEGTAECHAPTTIIQQTLPWLPATVKNAAAQTRRRDHIQVKHPRQMQGIHDLPFHEQRKLLRNEQKNALIRLTGLRDLLKDKRLQTAGTTGENANGHEGAPPYEERNERWKAHIPLGILFWCVYCTHMGIQMLLEGISSVSLSERRCIQS